MHHEPQPARRVGYRHPHSATGANDLRTGPVHDPQAYLEALRGFWAQARDHLDDPHYLEALPLLEQLRAIPEARDPDHHQAGQPDDTASDGATP